MLQHLHAIPPVQDLVFVARYLESLAFLFISHNRDISQTFLTYESKHQPCTKVLRRGVIVNARRMIQEDRFCMQPRRCQCGKG